MSGDHLHSTRVVLPAKRFLLSSLKRPNPGQSFARRKAQPGIPGLKNDSYLDALKQGLDLGRFFNL